MEANSLSRDDLLAGLRLLDGDGLASLAGLVAEGEHHLVQLELGAVQMHDDVEVVRGRHAGVHLGAQCVAAVLQVQRTLELVVSELLETWTGLGNIEWGQSAAGSKGCRCVLMILDIFRWKAIFESNQNIYVFSFIRFFLEVFFLSDSFFMNI